MRTTLTLDDDVSVMLKTLQDEQGISFKEAVNQALRRGLYDLKPDEREVFRQRSYDLGEQYLDLDNIGELLAVTESELSTELTPRAAP